jgi:uncharacterized protein YjiS (DUF1127 family)
MVLDYIWQNANPELRGHLRAANEARAATIYAVWRKVTAPVRGLIEAVRRANRVRATHKALSRLSDRALRDIGISRSEISYVAHETAGAPPEVGLTIADLRQTESIASAGGGVSATSRSHIALRRETPADQAAPDTRRRKAA